MTPRDTGTGAVLEDTVLPALRRNGYTITSQNVIGESFGGKRHRLDVLAQDLNGQEIPISVKWQQTSGTAEEKVPYEVIKMINAIKISNGRFGHAYIILGGSSGWTLKEFYLQGGLAEFIKDYHLVRLVSLEEFITLTNRKQL